MSELPGPSAVVEWTRGDRRQSRLMRNAGLGICSVGVKEQTTIQWAHGHVLTEERVMATVNKMIALADAEDAPFVITNPKIIKLTLQP